jgi:hypothetical protein
MPHTAKDEIFGNIAAMGPVTFNSMVHAVREQVIGLDSVDDAKLAVLDVFTDGITSGDIVCETDEGITFYSTPEHAPWL